MLSNNISQCQSVTTHRYRGELWWSSVWESWVCGRKNFDGKSGGRGANTMVVAELVATADGDAKAREGEP
uniref:Uncharacterized protein n=1 Tax=Leersia perrieri TaxID=77586 RepID=A0A0D9VNA5_9ORYZ